MHDSEQEHSGITGCRVTYESTIFYNEANKFSIIVVKTNDPRIPLQACSDRYYGDRMLRFTAVGYELPRTKAVELELDGEWVESKYGYQLQVEQWQEIVPQTADGLLAYLGSGLIKGIGPKTAEDIVATFGPDTLNILDNEPEKLLQIRGITEGKLKDIEESYAESRVLRNLMSLLGPFKITPATALKIYQHFGPACVDILKKCPYDLCQISGFGFKRVDGIVRKTDNRLHSTERIKGAVLYTLEDARSKSGHLFLPSEDLVKETLLLLNAPIPIPEQRVRTEEVQETLQQMILHGAVVAYKQYLYSPRVFGQEDDTARMIAERLANISVAENIESALESVRESLGITLSQKQEQAVRTAFQHGLTIITGSPGTGKTTVLKAIIEVFKNLHPKGKFALMAPTGRASRRMAESTGVDEARTLHSALGLGTGEEVGDGERVRFVDADLVIVDEFSMVDMWLAQQFFKRIGQHTRVVLVGDPNQLPSVGAGNVFYELIHSGMVPVTVLDWIFRQSKDGLIAYNAKFINEGSTKLYYGNDFVFVDSPTQIETARRIHPCDFLEMSNRDNTWNSCHCLEGGGYRGGCQSYMGDAVSMIFFTVSDEYTQDFHTAPRITREIFCYKDNVLLQSRLYPTDLEDQKTLYRSIVQQAIATCLDKPNLWSIKRGKDTEPYCESAADSNHYPDYEYGYAVVSLLKGESDYGKMTIGSVARCVCCGGEQKNHRSIRCAECGNMYVCKGCGKTVHGYGRYIDNHFYCNECSYECTVCREKFIGMPRIGIARSGEQRGICPACYAQVVDVCGNCTIHSDCLSIGANRFCPNQMSGLAA